jgi:hypothetical protein
MGRWDPRPRAADYDPDEIPDVDDITPAEHYAEQITTCERQLAGNWREQDSDRYDRLKADLDRWRRLLEAEQRDEHWQAGEGDRTLF